MRKEASNKAAARNVIGNVQERRRDRMSRFNPLFRDRIAALTCCSLEAEDVTESFPALLVALVSNYNTHSARKACFNIILSGGSIKTAAKALDLPLWLKRIPPEAFQEPISRPVSAPLLTAKISNFIPPKTNKACDWFSEVNSASDSGDEAFALWVARHCTSVAQSRRQLLFMSMASWAWHTDRPETIGHAILEKPWSAKMGLRRATEELTRWRRRAELACLIGQGIESPWLRPGSAEVYEFVPILTLNDFITESRAMNNCLDQYADRLGTGLIRIFSIRRNGRRIANLEVGPITSDGIPSIVQIKAASNRQASQAVWRATQTWLESQPVAQLPSRAGTVRKDGSKHQEFWGPYLDWLPQQRRIDFEKLILTRRRRVSRGHLHPIVDGAMLADTNL